MIPLEQITPILTGQNVNMRLFEARVAALLSCNNHTAFIIRQHMSQYADFGRQIHRNDALYIKLIFYALLRQRFEVEGIVPVVQPFQVGNRYHHFNTRPDVDWDQAQIDLFKQSQCDGWLAFICNETFNPNDVIFYHILGSDGAYFTQAAGQRVIPACHWIMPAFDCFSIGPVPAIQVEAHDIPAASFWEFARRTATYRGEAQTFLRAVYYVSELIHADAFPVPLNEVNIPQNAQYNMHLLNIGLDNLHVDAEPPVPGPVPVAPLHPGDAPVRPRLGRGQAAAAGNVIIRAEHEAAMEIYRRNIQAYQHNHAAYVIALREYEDRNVLWQEWRRRQDARNIAHDRGAHQREFLGFDNAQVVIQYHLLNAFFEVQPDAIPRPCDTNWMYRCFNIFPQKS